jgi:hypothetical protein
MSAALTSLRHLRSLELFSVGLHLAPGFEMLTNLTCLRLLWCSCDSLIPVVTALSHLEQLEGYSGDWSPLEPLTALRSLRSLTLHGLDPNCWPFPKPAVVAPSSLIAYAASVAVRLTRLCLLRLGVNNEGNSDRTCVTMAWPEIEWQAMQFNRLIGARLSDSAERTVLLSDLPKHVS